MTVEVGPGPTPTPALYVVHRSSWCKERGNRVSSPTETHDPSGTDVSSGSYPRRRPDRRTRVLFGPVLSPQVWRRPRGTCDPCEVGSVRSPGTSPRRRHGQRVFVFVSESPRGTERRFPVSTSGREGKTTRPRAPLATEGWSGPREKHDGSVTGVSSEVTSTNRGTLPDPVPVGTTEEKEKKGSLTEKTNLDSLPRELLRSSFP